MEEHFSSIMIKDTTQEEIKDVIDDKTMNKMLARVVWIFLFLFIYFQHVCKLVCA